MTISYRKLGVVIEHLEEELFEWCILEYCFLCDTIGAENLYILNVPSELFAPETSDSITNATHERIPEKLRKANWSSKSLVNVYQELYGENGQAVLLDPAAEEDLVPADGDTFQFMILGGILGTDPPKDRTIEVRRHEQVYSGRRRLGPLQMSTDTAANVAALVMSHKMPLESLRFCPFPIEIRVDSITSFELPFSYLQRVPEVVSKLNVKNEKDKKESDAIMAPGMEELLLKELNEPLI